MIAYFTVMDWALRVWVLCLIAGLLILALLLLFPSLRRLIRSHRPASPDDSAVTDDTFAETPPERICYTPPPRSGSPSVAEQQVVFDRLGELPQFGHLRDGRLVDWSTGVIVADCECRDPAFPVPHLRLTWPADRNGVGLTSRRALQGLLAYHKGLGRWLGKGTGGYDGSGDVVDGLGADLGGGELT